jgi:hypothetical protein
MKEPSLTYQEAIASPCTECKPSICCHFLQLDAIKTQKLLDLDKINFYLNFDNIEICMTPALEWVVYYNYPCRFYDHEAAACQIHATPQQPGICVHYNPYNCYYKRLRKTRETPCPEMIWINRQRMDYLTSQITFDNERAITGIPSMDRLFEEISRIPYHPPGQKDPPKREKPNTPGQTEIKTHLEFHSPCKNCESHCCQNLLIPQEKPATYSTLDFLRYTLGFPGIELGIADGQWYVIVATTCQHSQDNRCAIYDKPQRPLVCKYYNPMQCVHKTYLGKAAAEGFIKVGYEEYDSIMETFKFDKEGNIVETGRQKR